MGYAFSTDLLSLLNRSRSLSIAKHAELDEDRGVLDHGSQRADQPREISEEVLFFGGVK